SEYSTDPLAAFLGAARRVRRQWRCAYSPFRGVARLSTSRVVKAKTLPALWLPRMITGSTSGSYQVPFHAHAPLGRQRRAVVHMTVAGKVRPALRCGRVAENDHRLDLRLLPSSFPRSCAARSPKAGGCSHDGCGEGAACIALRAAATS